MPSEYAALDSQEKAFVIAAIQIKAENDRKAQRDAKSKSRRKR